MSADVESQTRPCPQCGKPIKADAKFCQYCAFDFSQPAPERDATEASRTCPQCGAQVRATATFCGNCGAKFGGEATNILPTLAAAGNKRGLLIAVAAVLAGVILIGGVAGWLLFGRRGGMPTGGAWPMYRGNPQRTGETFARLAGNSGNIAWRAQYPWIVERGGPLGHETMFSVPLVGNDGTIYIALSKGVAAYAPDGTLKWQQQAPSDVAMSLASALNANGEALVLGVKNDGGLLLYAVTSTEQVKWRFESNLQAADRVFADLVVAPDGTAYISGRVNDNEGAVVAVTSDGIERWRCRTTGVPAVLALGTDGRIYSSTFVRDRSAGTRHVFTSIDIINANGQLQRQIRVDDPTKESVHAFISAIGADGTIYCYKAAEAQNQNSRTVELLAFSDNGREIWNTPISEMRAVGSGAEFLLLARSALTRSGIYASVYQIRDDNQPANDYAGLAFFGLDGRRRYEIESLNSIGRVVTILPPVISADNHVVLPLFTETSFVVCLDPDNRVKWRVQLGEREVCYNVSVGADGTVYALSTAGTLYAIR